MCPSPSPLTLTATITPNWRGPGGYLPPTIIYLSNLQSVNQFIYLSIYSPNICLFIYMRPYEMFVFQPVLYDWRNEGCGMCYPVYWMVHIKEPLLKLERVADVVAACFLSCSMNGPLQCVWHHIIVNKMCWVHC